jgi:hypothetical protein
MFLKIKNRLKELMKENVIYTDGKTCEEIAARVKHLKNINGFYENDLEK